MKMKLAILLACSALAGFVIAATKPSSNEAAPQESAPAVEAQAEPAAAPAGPPVAPQLEPAKTAPPVPPPTPPELTRRPDADTTQTAPSAPTAKSVPAAAPISELPVSEPAPAQVENRPPSGIISSEIGGRDLQFLSSALEHGQMQLFLGELAKTKADTQQVKAVGDVLASTQAEENKKLMRLASLKGITLSNSEPAGKKALAAKLDKLSGPKFDKVLMEEIVAVNQKAVAIYQAATNSRDGDIKAFVDQGLPLAKEKLMLASKMSGTARRSDQSPGFRSQPEAPEATR